MTLHELATSLPNGFHDADVHSALIDYGSGTASFLIDVWVGTMAMPAGPDRERYRRGRVDLLELEYLAIDPPDPRSPHRGGGSIVIDACEADEELAAPRPHALGGFAGRFFVSAWNAFIHFSAGDAQLTWLDEDRA